MLSIACLILIAHPSLFLIFLHSLTQTPHPTFYILTYPPHLICSSYQHPSFFLLTLLQDTSMHCLCSDCRDSCTAYPDIPPHYELPMVGSVDVITFTLIIVYCTLAVAIITAAYFRWSDNDGGESGDRLRRCQSNE